MYQIKTTQVKESDLYLYRKKYLIRNIFVDLLIALIFSIILTIVITAPDKQTASIIFALVCIIVILSAIFNSIAILKELLQKDVLFHFKQGVFNYVVSDFADDNKRNNKKIYYCIDSIQIDTHILSSKFKKYDGKNVEIYFYVNSKNTNEAFLLNELD